MQFGAFDSVAWAGQVKRMTAASISAMLADFVLLDRDLTAIPPETIRETQILRTVVGGKTVFKKRPDVLIDN